MFQKYLNNNNNNNNYFKQLSISFDAGLKKNLTCLWNANKYGKFILDHHKQNYEEFKQLWIQNDDPNNFPLIHKTIWYLKSGHKNNVCFSVYTYILYSIYN